MGFYLIASEVGSVYEVVLPPDVNGFLESLSGFFSFGIDSPTLSSTPLECLGLSGYQWKLITYMLLPPVLVLLVVLPSLLVSHLTVRLGMATVVDIVSDVLVVRSANELSKLPDGGRWLEAVQDEVRDTRMRVDAPGR